MSSSEIPVLFFLMEFAPVNTTGQFRNTKLIKYIAQHHIKPIVITFETAAAANIFNAKVDEQLVKELPSNTIIYRIPIPIKKEKRFQKWRNFFNIYFSTREKLAERWMPSIQKHIDEIIKKENQNVFIRLFHPLVQVFWQLLLPKNINCLLY
jgi:hypothetical protein